MISVEEKKKIAVQHWQLSYVTKIYTQSNRGVYCAKSPKYGEVILKINNSLSSIASEYHMLKTVGGRYGCRVYEFDSENGLLLEEKITPGTVLRKEADVDVRIQKFAEVFQNIHKEMSGDYHYSTYFEWIKNARALVEKIEQGEIIIEQIKRAEEICGDLFDKYAERVVLHGDLHHDNMLLSEDGNCKIIDAKGVLGPEIFDIPRFVLNEADEKQKGEGKKHILYVIEKISQMLSYSAKDLKDLFFMEAALENSWCLESGNEPDWQTMRLAEEIIQFPVGTK